MNLRVFVKCWECIDWLRNCQLLRKNCAVQYCDSVTPHLTLQQGPNDWHTHSPIRTLHLVGMSVAPCLTPRPVALTWKAMKHYRRSNDRWDCCCSHGWPSLRAAERGRRHVGTDTLNSRQWAVLRLGCCHELSRRGPTLDRSLGAIWLWIWTGGGLLWLWWWTCWFRKMWGNVLSRWGTVGFWRRALLQGVIYAVSAIACPRHSLRFVVSRHVSVVLIISLANFNLLAPEFGI